MNINADITDENFNGFRPLITFTYQSKGEEFFENAEFIEKFSSALLLPSVEQDGVKLQSHPEEWELVRNGLIGLFSQPDLNSEITNYIESCICELEKNRMFHPSEDTIAERSYLYDVMKNDIRAMRELACLYTK